VSTGDLREAARRVNDAKREFVNLLNYFGEDPKTTPDEFFGIWNKFIQGLEVCIKFEELGSETH
jgi:hypothetical protein